MSGSEQICYSGKYREHFGNKVHCLKDGEIFLV